MTLPADLQMDGALPLPSCTSEQFAVHFEDSFRKLWLIAVGIARNAALADDIVQEAAIVALAKLDQFTPGTNFTAWMGQTVRYVALNQVRRERRRRGRSLDDVTAGTAVADTDAAARPNTLASSSRGVLSANQCEFDDQIVDALSGLGDTARACLLLRTIEGLEYREISRVLDMPEGTAMSHVHRARRFLRERLTASGAPSSNGKSR